jgi:endoribonuclease Dicer
MREESLRLASIPFEPLTNTICKEEFYVVQSTGAVVTLNSSIQLIYFSARSSHQMSLFSFLDNIFFLFIP